MVNPSPVYIWGDTSGVKCDTHRSYHSIFSDMCVTLIHENTYISFLLPGNNRPWLLWRNRRFSQNLRLFETYIAIDLESWNFLKNSQPRNTTRLITVLFQRTKVPDDHKPALVTDLQKMVLESSGIRNQMTTTRHTTWWHFFYNTHLRKKWFITREVCFNTTPIEKHSILVYSHWKSHDFDAKTT